MKSTSRWLCVWLLAWVGNASAAGIALGTSALVDSGHVTAWIAAPEGQIAAVNLADGSLRWRGPAMGHPLALIDGQLLVARRPDALANWPFALVNAETGEVNVHFDVAMPDGVMASLEPMPNQQFEVFMRADAGQLQLHWFSQRWPLRGAKLDDDDGNQSAEGVVQVDVAAARAVGLGRATPPIRPRIDLSAEERVAGLDAVQLRSADDRHLVQRQPQEDPQLGQRWIWEIYTRATGQARGRVTLPEAAAPWLLVGEQLVWVARPLVLATEDGSLRDVPARLIAVDLKDSTERWSVILRSPLFEGSAPP
ncbi:MAG: hypothetical protein ACT4NL_07610 [Pseudomarimonas sp.]